MMAAEAKASARRESIDHRSSVLLSPESRAALIARTAKPSGTGGGVSSGAVRAARVQLFHRSSIEFIRSFEFEFVDDLLQAQTRAKRPHLHE